MNRMTIGASVLALMPMTAAAQVQQGEANASFEPAFENQTRAPALDTTPVTISTFAEGLANPWGIAPLPDGTWLVTERPGRLRMIAADGSVSDAISGLPEIFAQGQGGLLDVAVSPDFADDRTVFLTYAKPMEDGSITAAAKGVLSDDGTALEQVEDIWLQNRASPTAKHYGSRIIPTDDGMVWITTGEHSSFEERIYAQNIDITYGKIIRINADGSIPDDNPFVGQEGEDSIWSYGHRNVQGATIDPDGTLWTIEHGPAGGDELNAPEAGKNYGWPVISYGIRYDGGDIGNGEAVMEGMEQPVYYWDPVIAPGGGDFYDGDYAPWQDDLFIGSLAPGAVVRLDMEDGRVVGEERLATDVGRVRDVQNAGDGSLLILIDNPNGAVLRLTPDTE
ncbi:PQQ-dependent sugar dehydrogenase [Yoonia sp. 208BN28-4]|uniref:PQQ-dependent sugar dehydrogenase n=1 Tax=Yoonia sp. 208BN28-4 TaxID=3126505 RepID=UPI0030A225F0